MPTDPIIECKPSKWFKTRAVLVLLMFAFFTAWFIKDGYSGYRQKNLEYVAKLLFSEKKKEGKDEFGVLAIEEFKAAEYTPESWAEFAKKQTIATPAAERGLLPRDYDFDTKWPDELVNGYEELKNEDLHSLWVSYSGRMKYDESPADALFDEESIMWQYITAGICGVLFLIAAYISLRNMGRRMLVTDTTYTAPGGKEILFTSMKKIDKRKWDNKGLAVIHYEEEGEVKKAKVDGMIYGQFKEEDGAPAEALFSHILDNFKGELIEYVSEDEEEVASESPSDEDSEPSKS